MDLPLELEILSAEDWTILRIEGILEFVLDLKAPKLQLTELNRPAQNLGFGPASLQTELSCDTKN